MTGNDGFPQIVRLRTNVIHTAFLSVRLSALDAIVKEESNTEEEPCSEKPGHGHDKKGQKLVPALSANFIDKLFQGSQLES